MKDIIVGLIGFGTVGTGVVRLLQQNMSQLERRLGARIILKKIADLDIVSPRGVSINRNLLTKDAGEVLDDPEISIVIELMGGLEPARSFILQAMRNKKHVVTANKALLANFGDEIFAAAESENVDIGFEASVGGTIPVIKTIKESLAANRIKSIFGIMNGTSNYILSKMTDEGKDLRRGPQGGPGARFCRGRSHQRHRGDRHGAQTGDHPGPLVRETGEAGGHLPGGDLENRKAGHRIRPGTGLQGETACHRQSEAGRGGGEDPPNDDPLRPPPGQRERQLQCLPHRGGRFGFNLPVRTGGRNDANRKRRSKRYNGHIARHAQRHFQEAPGKGARGKDDREYISLCRWTKR